MLLFKPSLRINAQSIDDEAKRFEPLVYLDTRNTVHPMCMSIEQVSLDRLFNFA